MIIKNKIIEKLDQSSFCNVTQCIISNSILSTIDLIGFELDFPLTIEQSIISDLSIHTCWFKKGLLFKNNQVLNYVDYQMGGHNEAPIIISGNIFFKFLNFFDCQFVDDVIIQNNILLEGSNLIGNTNEEWKNLFGKAPFVKDNIGLLNIDGIGK